MIVSAGATIVVESLTLLGEDPPPDTATMFTWGEVAVDATFTVTVITG
jgi:hypothetical protein